jgi:hypothetical protein
MRHTFYPLVLLITLVAVPPVTASAGTSDATCFHGSLTSSVEPDGLHIQITLTWWGWGNCWGTEPAVVDVYRRALGATCDPMVLLTDQPLLWPGVTQSEGPAELGEVVDGGAVAGTAYEYILRAVDAGRNPIPGDDDVVLGYASEGDALISHGTLVAMPDCGISSISFLDPCPDACFPQFNVASYAVEVGAYFNTDTELLVYGQFDTEWAYLCNFYVPRVVISSVTPSLCVVAVEATTWGVVKTLYR